MNNMMPRDDKLTEILCRVILFAILSIIASVFSDGFTFIEGMIVFILTGIDYDTTIILNNQRKDEYRRLHKRIDKGE